MHVQYHARFNLTSCGDTVLFCRQSVTQQASRAAELQQPVGVLHNFYSTAGSFGQANHLFLHIEGSQRAIAALSATIGLWTIDVPRATRGARPPRPWLVSLCQDQHVHLIVAQGIHAGRRACSREAMRIEFPP
jgi:hypothetical protein